MLTGGDSFMKIDRWLLRFCEDSTGVKGYIAIPFCLHGG